jgi:hypothetical protein
MNDLVVGAQFKRDTLNVPISIKRYFSFAKNKRVEERNWWLLGSIRKKRNNQKYFYSLYREKHLGNSTRREIDISYPLHVKLKKLYYGVLAEHSDLQGSAKDIEKYFNERFVTKKTSEFVKELKQQRSGEQYKVVVEYYEVREPFLEWLLHTHGREVNALQLHSALREALMNINPQGLKYEDYIDAWCHRLITASLDKNFEKQLQKMPSER